MRIVVDMQGAQNGSRFRGIGRYSSAFVKHLIDVAEHHEVVLVLSAAFPETLEPLRREFECLERRGNIRVWHPVTPTPFADPRSTSRRLVSELIREAFFASLQADVVLVTSLFEGCGDNVVTSIGGFMGGPPVAVILYDFIPFLYPHEYLGNDQLKAWYAAKLEHLKKANLLLAISESARDEALDITDINPLHVVNISAGVDSKFGAECGTSEAELRKKFAITRHFLMYTGASDPRKNLLRLVEAFALLPADVLKGHQLVLAGKMTKRDAKNLKLQMSRAGLHKRQVVFLGQVSDSDLIGLYRAARACIMPSYHEGFGLPVLEAMACGAPVIGSNVSSIPEVIGLDEALFDPHSTESMTNAIERVLLDEAFRQRLISHGTVRCALFSWEAVARKGLAAIEASFGSNATGSVTFAPDRLRSILNQLISQVGRTLVENNSERSDFMKSANSIAANFQV